MVGARGPMVCPPCNRRAAGLRIGVAAVLAAMASVVLLHVTLRSQLLQPPQAELTESPGEGHTDRSGGQARVTPVR